MLSLWGGSEKLGPYVDAVPKHQFKQSEVHRDVGFCGSYHEVSNPAVGDLARNQGGQATPTVSSPVACLAPWATEMPHSTTSRTCTVWCRAP